MAQTLEIMIENYCNKYSIQEDGKEELIQLLNQSLIEISRGILATHQTTTEKQIKKEINNELKRFKSKKAEEYAIEHGLSIYDFDIQDISKKDVETKVRDMTKNKKDNISFTGTKSVEKETTEVIKRKQKVICCGINKKGEACKAIGTIKPDGAKKMYCFRHADDFRSFECDSDSSDNEEKSDDEPIKEEEYS